MASEVPGSARLSLWRRMPLTVVSLIVATAIWVPSVHLIFKPNVEAFYREEGVPTHAEALAARSLELWTNPGLREREIGRMRDSNAEWDFMARTFLVLSLSNLALRDRERTTVCLEVMDRIIDETMRLEKEHGHLYFMMAYGQANAFVEQPARSIFVDGEIAMMIAARRLVEERDDLRPGFHERIAAIEERMGQGPVLCAESYPNECWMFCNAVALAALSAGDALDGTDHSAFFVRWLKTARRDLTHRDTGLLISSFTLEGSGIDGPEGSSIWTVAHFLQVVDKDFAQDQYDRARNELERTLCGFGWGREWPDSWQGQMDIDSGPIVPWLDISAGSSGQALLAASAFNDVDYLTALHTTLEFAAFPDRKGDTLRRGPEIDSHFAQTGGRT